MEKALHDERPIGILRCAATTIDYSFIPREEGVPPVDHVRGASISI